MNEELNIPQFIIDLTNYLIVFKNLSKVYINNMLVTLSQFLEFINVYKFKCQYSSTSAITLDDIRSLTNSDIYSFIYFLAESKYKVNSRIVKIEHLKTFFNYLHTIKNTIFTEPFKKINTDKKIEKKLPNYLSLEEAKKIVELYANSTDAIEIRDNAILHLFLNSGLRLSELKNLSINDLDLKNNKFSIIGKGNKERTGYINDITRKALDKYLEIRELLNPKSKTLFVSKYGLRMCSTSIEKIVKRAYKRANVSGYDNYCVHTLRHTCATLLYRNGIDLKLIKEILGHVEIDTTEIYTHLYDKEVMDSMLEHPLAQFKIANAEAYNCA